MAGMEAFILAGLLNCQTPPPPVINFHFTNNSPTFISEKSSDDLSGMKIDTTFSHFKHEVFTVGGITRGNVLPSFRIGFHHITNEVTGKGCSWIERIDIEVKYEPVVFIAKNYTPGTCRYRTISEHELRHVATDVLTIEQFQPYFEASIRNAAQGVGLQGPADAAGLKTSEDAITKQITTALNQAANAMQISRQARQQAIDTRQEYMRVSKACPNEE